MHVIIIDDEQSCHDDILELLATRPDLQLLGEAYNIEDGQALIQSVEPDLIFLDIEMPDGTGFDLLQRIDHSKYAVIFVTAHNAHAIRAFEFAALDYILKPISSISFQKAVARAEERIKNRSLEERILELNEVIANYQEKTLPKKLKLTNNDGTHLIPIEQITYLYVADGCTEVHQQNGRRTVVARNLIEFERHFKAYSYFLKIHSSTIINLHFAEQLTGNDLIINGDTKLSVSRSRMPALRTALEHL